MAGNKIKIEDRSNKNKASVTNEKANIKKKYDNEKLEVNNKNPDNTNLKNTNKDIKEEIEKNKSSVIPEQKITDIRTYGSDKDYIVVEMVGKYRNIWNYLTKPESITRRKEDKKDIEVVPIEYEFSETKEIEFILSQIEKIFIDGVSKDISLENLLLFADRQGEIFNEALLEFLENNYEIIKKHRAKIFKATMLRHL